jgi:hypothetical protein
VRCECCGLVAPAFKTCRWRTGTRTFVLCDPCHSPMRGAMWIVPGMVAVHGVCRGCSGWFSLRDLSHVTLGGKRGAPSGRCTSCAHNA